MGIFIDLTNQKFGRLIVLKPRLQKDNRGRTYWICKCKCGNITSIRSDHLQNGAIQSCNCITKEGNNKKHKMSHTKFYSMWNNMKQRCSNINNLKYKNYGGRGIIYDSKWENFIFFYNDMYFKYLYYKRIYGKNHLSLERKDVNGNYCFNNCIFIPLSEQPKNRRNTK